MASAIVERRTTLNLIQFTRKMLSMENGTNQNTDIAKKKWKGVFIRRRGVHFCSELQPVTLKNMRLNSPNNMIELLIRTSLILKDGLKQS